MNSFYGGKQGRTYHIVERFDCVSLSSFDRDYVKQINKQLQVGNIIKQNGKYKRIATITSTDPLVYTTTDEISITGMVDQFKKGGVYTKVNYGQYVIIDTIKNLGLLSNNENGLLFRRGFNYSGNGITKPDVNDSKYWIVELQDSIQVSRTFNQAVWMNDWSQWVEDVGGGAIYEGQIVGPKGDVGQLEGVTWNQLSQIAQMDSIDLQFGEDDSVIIDPPDESSDGIIDYIKFGWAQVKDSKGNISGHKISFKFYKPEVIIAAEQVSPYGTQYLSFVDNKVNPSETTKWKYTFPNTQRSSDEPSDKQSYTENTSLIKESNGSQPHPFYYNYQIAVPHGKKGDSVSKIFIEENQTDNNYLYLFYKIKNYDTVEEGQELEKIEISKYNIIDNITPEYKTRTVIEQNLSEYTFGSLARNSSWPNGIYLVCVQGETQGTPANVPINISLNNLKVGQVYYNENQTSLWQCIQIPVSNALDGFNISFTAQEELNFTIRTIDFIYMDNKGNIYTVYSSDSNPDQEIDNKDEPFKIGNIPVLKQIVFDDFTKISSDDDVNSSYDTGKSIFKSKIIYDGQTEEETIISSPINYPVDIQRQGDVLYILYSDPEYRKKIPANSRKLRSYTYNNVTHSYWYQIYPLTPDMYHVLGDVDPKDLVLNIPGEQPGTFSHGVQNYPYGQESEKIYSSRAGWVLSITTIEQVGTEELTTVDFYAYDYTDLTTNGKYTIKYKLTPDSEQITGGTHWYKIQTRKDYTDLSTYYIIDTENENYEPTSGFTNLKDNGIWFVLR